ncbi:hypothetical protein QMP26_41100 (plasmid) [Enterocloster clostridioformis]
MADLREEVPREFSDDERWYRYFTRKSIFALLVMGVFSMGIVKFFTFIGIQLVGIYTALILTCVVMAVIMLPIPEGDCLHGSGCTCDTILMRLYVRRKNQYIYVKKLEAEERE